MCHRPLEYPAGNDTVARQLLLCADAITALLSSPRVEGERLTPQAAIDEVENAFLAAANKDFALLSDIRKRLRTLSTG
jgi:hypothetical protein